MRTITGEERSPEAGSRGPGAARRGRAAPRTGPAPIAEPTPTAPLRSAEPEAPAVSVTTVRMLRVDPGLYALRIGELTGAPGDIAGMSVPVAHVSAPFAEDGNGVEIVAAFPRRGPWLGREGGTVILRSPPRGGYVIVTVYGGAVYGGAGQHTGELALDLHRLDGPGGMAALGTGQPELPPRSPGSGATGPRAAVLSGTRDIPTEILLHIERAGDRLFPGRGWVGALGRKMRIEAFGFRPLEQLAPADVEMKGFLPNGGETPWVAGGTLCGTRGRGLPLTGFALRVVPQHADRFDVLYQGSFFAGGISEQHRNGSPCRAAAGDDPLEAINIRLIERVPEPAGASDDEGTETGD